MPRRHIPQRKPPLADPRYGDVTVSRFVNRMMLHGKRSTSQQIMYEALGDVEKKVSDATPVEVFHKALENVMPVIEVKSRRVGGSTYQVPVEVKEGRREALAMRWLINAARSRSGKSMGLRLGQELVDAYNGTGTAFKKKEDTHRMAEANKAFAHYRW
ncbi:30S ribosomal protein S7 [Alkalispirochaeta sphaeroplastigenens]|uniref:Small ribosomal subunit protein uS7 n=1 Tax=Alkalispirochaeta sphaeroplastigenens TaxID=1187066 RepID=A0A2S4JGR8_9SPIO|nr:MULTISPECIES: 30S ribosomal protein S7 [Alkalispirochaeta]POQ98754.1 30S ribosomal protein S7 [Alkalispirochaeta sphaeroplastigenens]